MLARLIENGRTLAKAELALFRTDFYRRIGRARSGALLCLIGAIMGQAAAVTLLVTLSFVLTPYIGRLGGSLVSVTLGVVLAVVLIQLGVRKLLLVIEDPEDEDEPLADKAHPSPVDELFDRVRARSQAARNQLAETMDEAQARLHPQSLIADLLDEVVDQTQAMVHRVLDAIQRRPVRTGAAIAAVVLLLIRPPIGRIVTGIGRATRRGAASLKTKKANDPAGSGEEEKS